MGKFTTEYTLYKGEEVIAVGTAEEISRKLGINPKTVRFYASPTQQRRAAAPAHPGNRLIAVRNNDKNEEGCNE